MMQGPIDDAAVAVSLRIKPNIEALQNSPDATAWCILAGIIVIVRAPGLSLPLWLILTGLGAFILVMLFVVRRALQKGNAGMTVQMQRLAKLQAQIDELRAKLKQVL